MYPKSQTHFFSNFTSSPYKAGTNQSSPPPSEFAVKGAVSPTISGASKTSQDVRHYGIQETNKPVKLRTRESPSSISGSIYCLRIPILNKIKGYGGTKNVKLYLGSIEHEYIEFYVDLAKKDSTTQKKLFSDQLHKERKIEVTQYIIDLVTADHPEFLDEVRDTLASLNWRINVFYNYLKNEARRRLTDFNFKKTLDLIFPIKTEYEFYSQKYDIKGYADFIFRDVDGTLIIVDIKSHKSRIDCLIHRDQHFAQMAVYAVLAEEEFGKPVNKCQILYSQDMFFEDFDISSEDKVSIIEQRNMLRTILEGPMPPVLTGEDAYKCNHCYSREICEQISESTQSEFPSYTPTLLPSSKGESL